MKLFSTVDRRRNLFSVRSSFFLGREKEEAVDHGKCTRIMTSDGTHNVRFE